MLDADRPSPMADWPLDPADRRRVDAELAELMAEVRDRFRVPRPVARLMDRLGDFVLDGGKRLRPRLCLATYRLMGRAVGPTPKPVMRVAASLEFFHAFMLIHDDLVDGSLLRREKQVLHRSLRRDHSRPEGQAAAKWGEDLALVGGDLLFAIGMRVVAGAGVEPTASARVQTIVADVLLETGLGQILDVATDALPLSEITEAQVLETYLGKTARYTVSGPMVIGAVLAGADPVACEAIDHFGERLGLAYQIRNDLKVLEEPIGREDRADLEAGKRTLPLWEAHHRGGRAIRVQIERALSASAGAARGRRLYELIHESGAIERCRDRLFELDEGAMVVLADSPLDEAERSGMRTLADRLRGDGRPAACAPEAAVERRPSHSAVGALVANSRK